MSPYRQVEVVRVEECCACARTKRRRQKLERAVKHFLPKLGMVASWTTTLVIAAVHWHEAAFALAAFFVAIVGFTFAITSPVDLD
jgi:hypothetical protein